MPRFRSARFPFACSCVCHDIRRFRTRKMRRQADFFYFAECDFFCFAFRSRNACFFFVEIPASAVFCRVSALVFSHAEFSEKPIFRCCEHSSHNRVAGSECESENLRAACFSFVASPPFLF